MMINDVIPPSILVAWKKFKQYFLKEEKTCLPREQAYREKMRALKKLSKRSRIAQKEMQSLSEYHDNQFEVIAYYPPDHHSHQ